MYVYSHFNFRETYKKNYGSRIFTSRVISTIASKLKKIILLTFDYIVKGQLKLQNTIVFPITIFLSFDKYFKNFAES